MPTPFDERALKAALSAAIDDHLGILKDLGYSAPHLAPTDSVVLPGLRATFKARAREIWIDVAYPSPDPRALKRHVMLAWLFRSNGATFDGSLYVEWFAALHRPDLYEAFKRLSDQDGTLHDFVRAAIPIYATLFREELRPIASGESWQDGVGDPEVARAFEFLGRDYGFSKPESRSYGHEWAHTYTRGDTKFGITCDTEPDYLVTLEIAGAFHGWRIASADAVAFLKSHPEVFSGDFREWEKIARRVYFG